MDYFYKEKCMTENLLQKLEEKMMTLLSEVEKLRKEVGRLHHENAVFRIERETHTKRLQDFISLLDSVNALDTPLSHPHLNGVAKPALVQG